MHDLENDFSSGQWELYLRDKILGTLKIGFSPDIDVTLCEGCLEVIFPKSYRKA